MEKHIYRDQAGSGDEIGPLQRLKQFGLLLKDAYRVFRRNDPLRMAAATSFFASFALPPVMIILIEVFGIFGDTRRIRRDLFRQLGIALDQNVALQVRDILKNLHYLSLSPGMRMAGFVFLLFVASTLFEVIKNSLNQLWQIRRKGREGIASVLLHRMKSIGIIIAGGLLSMLALVFYRAASVVAVMAWFVLILRYLSYGRPAWPTAVGGGIFTGLLFTIGEGLLHFLLSYNNIKTIYGASTSLVLLLLFIFYCSFIFYFGACFTEALANRRGRPLPLAPHAVRYRMQSEELG